MACNGFKDVSALSPLTNLSSECDCSRITKIKRHKNQKLRANGYIHHILTQIRHDGTDQLNERYSLLWREPRHKSMFKNVL